MNSHLSLFLSNCILPDSGKVELLFVVFRSISHLIEDEGTFSVNPHTNDLIITRGVIQDITQYMNVII
jgi:hypothetical protein